MMSSRFLLSFLIYAICLPVSQAVAKPVSIISTSVILDRTKPGRTQIGELEFRGGLRLSSTAPGFGGFSALSVSADGRTLTAISDRGRWLTTQLAYTEAGHLLAAYQGRMGVLRDPDGTPVGGFGRDAEALTFLPDGTALVAFERRHRILAYPPSKTPFGKNPKLLITPAGLADAPINGGAETLVHVGRRFLFLLTERQNAPGQALAGWIGRDGIWQPFAYAKLKGYRPTDGTMMPNGNLLLLERKYTRADGPSVRIMELSRAKIGPRRTLKAREIARLVRPITVDNFEGISARRSSNREILIYIISDDNFNSEQRTLLLMFAYRGG